MSLQLFETFLT